MYGGGRDGREEDEDDRRRGNEAHQASSPRRPPVSSNTHQGTPDARRRSLRSSASLARSRINTKYKRRDINAPHTLLVERRRRRRRPRPPSVVVRRKTETHVCISLEFQALSPLTKLFFSEELARNEEKQALLAGRRRDGYKDLKVHRLHATSPYNRQLTRARRHITCRRRSFARSLADLVSFNWRAAVSSTTGFNFFKGHAWNLVSARAHTQTENCVAGAHLYSANINV